MWQILRAEYKYVFWTVSFVTVAMLSGFTFYLQFYERARIEHILAPLTVAIILQVLIHRTIEKRDRFNAVLPLDVREVAKARILLYAVPATVIYGIYFLLNSIFRDSGRLWVFDIFDILMFFGLILLSSSAILVQNDVFVVKLNKHRNPELDVFIIILLLSIVFIGIPLVLAPIWHWSGNVLRILCFVAGLGSLYPAVKTYGQRRSYLE